MYRGQFKELPAGEIERDDGVDVRTVKERWDPWVAHTGLLLDGDGCIQWSALGALDEYPFLWVRVIELVRAEINRLRNADMRAKYGRK